MQRQMQEVGNLFLAISLEGKPEVNDLRRGKGVYGKVMHAMDLLEGAWACIWYLYLLHQPEY